MYFVLQWRNCIASGPARQVGFDVSPFFLSLALGVTLGITGTLPEEGHVQPPKQTDDAVRSITILRKKERRALARTTRVVGLGASDRGFETATAPAYLRAERLPHFPDRVGGVLAHRRRHLVRDLDRQIGDPGALSNHLLEIGAGEIRLDLDQLVDRLAVE